jgi:outer membrane protein OmpA-like peptidoglycan-associated protein
MWLWIWLLLFLIIFCVWNKLQTIKNSQQEATVPVTIIPEQKNDQTTTQQAADTVTKKDIMLKIIKEDDMFRISGVFPSEEAVKQILNTIASQTNKKVEKGAVIIDPNADNKKMFASISDIAKTLSNFQNGFFEYKEKTITLNGTVTSAESKEAAIKAVSEIDQKINIQNQITVEAPPKIVKPVVKKNPPSTDANKTTKKTEKEPLAKKREAEQKAQKALDKILKNKRVEFLYAKDKLTQKSKKIIDQVVRVLKKYPNIHVEIGGHTDSDGLKENNLKLSQKRAEAIKRYLVSKGIDANRLVAKGYGESKPLVKNDTPAHKQINRRVEFKVIK